MILTQELSSTRKAPLALATSKAGNFLRQQIANGNNALTILFSFVVIMKRQICPQGRGWESSISEEKVFSVNSSNFLHFIRQSSLFTDVSLLMAREAAVVLLWVIFLLLFYTPFLCLFLPSFSITEISQL